MTHLDPHIFRAYDIRGKAGSQITEDVCRLIGQAFGTVLREKYGIDHPRVALGRDARTHSPAFEKATAEGLMAAGCHVFLIGQTPSPVNYFTICTQKLDGSVQITASHNPPTDNGLKLQVREAEAFAGGDLQKLRERIESGQRSAVSGQKGKIESFDAITPYLDHLTKLFHDKDSGLQVVIDGGNGVAGPVYSEAFKRIGCTVTEMYIEPDGTFPNHPADPSKRDTLKELQEKVREANAHCGFGFDGDGDRIGIVDETGTILSADQTLLLLAKDHLQHNPGAPVIFTVSNSSILATEIPKLGGKPIMTKVGHSFVEHAMREYGAALGGEQSGHFFCGEGYFGFDDALVAALRVTAILKASGKPLSALIADFPKVYQAPEWRPHCPDSEKTRIVAAVTAHFAKNYPVNTLDGARIDFGDGAWAGIRQSNTSPCLSICIEARSPEKLAAVQEIVLGHLKSYPKITLS